MSDISSGISPIGGSSVPRQSVASSTNAQPLRGGGSIDEAGSGNRSSRVTENSSISHSSTSISIIDQNSQPQSAADFAKLMILSMMLSDDEEKDKTNPFMLMMGFAMLSAMQEQSQSAQFLQFDSQSLEYSQSITTTESVSSQSATYQQPTGAGGDAGTGLGGKMDVTG